MFVSSCKDKPEEEKPQHWTVHAKVENAEEFSNVVEVRLMAGNTVLARSDFKDGSFTIELPEMVPQNYLRPFVTFTNLIPMRPPKSLLNNKNVKAAHGYLKGFDEDGNFVGDLLLIKSSNDSQYVLYLGFFIYVDAFVTVLGSDRFSTYSITARKGWNILYRTTNYDLETVDWSTTIPIDGMRWYILHRMFH